MTPKYQDRVDGYPYLSRPFDSMKSEYDVVVIGSGYGAGVAASRMARAGKSVAMLELGWERRPGSYPQSLSECLKDFRISGESGLLTRLWNYLPSNATQFFQLVIGQGQHVFLAHALGGCSLINSGVFLEADESTLKMSSWPQEIREDPTVLRPYYNRASQMLQPTVYPGAAKKTENLRRHSIHNFCKVPLTTFFKEERNSAGVRMEINEGSGNECTGLNDGSKNSVATTYLIDAWNWGAEIFCGCKVQFVERDSSGDGYIIYFLRHGLGREGFKDEFKHQLFWVKVKEFCFLGAGTLGTTEILLRSRANGMVTSPLLGRNMSGNGDMLIFGYNGSDEVNGIAGKDATPGPTITAMLDHRVQDPSRNVLGGYVVQDGVIPQPFNSSIQLMLILQTFWTKIPFVSNIPASRIRKFLSALKSVADPYVKGGAIQRTSTYLVMSHDSNEGTLALEEDQIKLRLPAEGRSDHSRMMRRNIRELSGQSGAKIGHSYLYGRDKEQVSVHPLGGCKMSEDGTGRGGVTNHLGQVFCGKGSKVYEGLICCDGSIIPTSLGVNPLATITALAERSTAMLAQRYGSSIDLDTRNGSIDITSIPRVTRSPCRPSMEQRTTGWRFTEVLTGHVSFDLGSKQFLMQEHRGKGASCAMSAYLTIEILHDPKSHGRYTGTCMGTVSCSALSRAPLRATSGTIEFFVPKKTHAEATAICYSLDLVSIEGLEFSFHGHKHVDSNIAFSVSKTWTATTALNVRIMKDCCNIGGGILRITLAQFLKQLATFRCSEGLHLATLWSLLAFLAFFATRVCLFFFRPLSPLRFPIISTVEPKKRSSSVINLRAKDGVEVTLEVFEPISDASDRPPILCLPGVTGVGAQHNLYALPYLSCNVVDYFTALGHRCYALNPRWTSASVAEKSVVYDCRLDVAAGLNHIGNNEARKPYVIAHCQGSVALAMGLLDGTISASSILGITANSVFMNQVFAYWNGVKGSTTLLVRLYEILAGSFFPMFSRGDDTHIQRLLDAILRFYPVRRRRDLCASTACRRTSFGFGLLWNHENLNREMHDNIHTFFAGTHTRLLAHVVRMGSAGQCLNSNLQPLMTPENLENLRGVPILFISGTDNEVFDPETTLKDYEMLRRKFGEDMYRRFLVDKYGHLDPIMGKHADRDVYWRILAHLESCEKREG